MQSRIEILKSLLKRANTKKDDFSYSAVMRRMRKKHPELVRDFMKAFKNAFDTGQDQGIEKLETIALMEAIKSVGIE